LIGRGAALGLRESGNFPAAIKATVEWFPKKERPLQRNLQRRHERRRDRGAAHGPYIALNWGWRWAFIGTGVIGFLWLLACDRIRDARAQQPARRSSLHPQRSIEREAPVPYLATPDIGRRAFVLEN
jgi:hypothetical protein